MVWREEKVAVVTKQYARAVADRSRKRHAREVDQRDWDYGSRLPRERRAPEPWVPGTGPDSPEMSPYDPVDPFGGPARLRTEPSWGSVTDTGSMAPIPDAVAWSERADAWSQRSAAPETSAPWEEPPSRWSDVAATGRPAFPPEGVGWRSETAEWRSATETARWRTTTEWRSSEGTSGWRSTTEAWQTSGNRDGRRPTEPPTRQPAISGTAWPTPSADEQPRAAQATPAPPWQAEPTPPWQAEPTPSWQAQSAAPRPADAVPPWQTPPTPPWQGEPTPPWQAGEPLPAQPYREDRTRRQAETRPTWQEPAEPAPAWPTTEPPPSWSAAGAGQRPPDPRPSWQQTSKPAQSWQQGSEPTQSWQQGPEPTQGWQQTSEPARGRQQSPEPTQGWQQTSEPAQSWQQTRESVPSWQAPEPAQTWQQQAAEPARSWQQAPEPARGWQQSTEQPPGPSQSGPSQSGPGWQQAPQPAPSWPQQPVEPVPTWQNGVDLGNGRTGREARPSWQTSAEPTSRTPTSAEPAPSRPAAAEPRQAPDTRPSWQQLTSWEQPAESRRTEPGDARPPWQQHLEPPAARWQSETDDRSARQIESRPSWQGAASALPGDHGRETERPRNTDRERDTATWATPEPPVANPYGGAWSPSADYDDGRHLVRADDRAQWRRESAAGRHGDDGPRRVGRRRAAEPDDARGGGTGWTVQSDADNWAGHTDTGAMPLYQDSGARDDGDWRRDTRAGRAGTDRRARSGGRPREEPDSGSWARDDEPRTDTGSWRRRAAQPDGPTWRGAADSPEDTAAWRRSREIEAASDPWARGAADTGVGDLDWQPSDTGDWRTADDRPRRRAADPDDPRRTAQWREGPRRAASDDPDRPAPQDTPTEVRQQPAEPDAWQRELGARGTASYREGRTEDWRRELAAQGNLTDGEPKRFGTSDFPPFRPSGASDRGAPDRGAPGRGAPDRGAPDRGTARAAGSATVRARGIGPGATPSDGRPREELLVGAGGSGASSWQRPPDTQWPPRQAVGYQRSAGGVAGPYERRPVGALPDPTGRRNLLDGPEDDLEEVTGGPLAAVGYTALWYGVPVVLFVLYMLVIDNAQQSRALDTLADAAPQFGLSLALSMAVAVGLRWASGSWKAASVGLAAAVMGGGLATVLMSAITGDSLT